MRYCWMAIGVAALEIPDVALAPSAQAPTISAANAAIRYALNLIRGRGHQ
jgi:hypothetical protein